jgi:hypothetical protein
LAAGQRAVHGLGREFIRKTGLILKLSSCHRKCSRFQVKTEPVL